MPDTTKKSATGLTPEQAEDLKMLSNYLSETFTSFVLAKTYINHAHNTLRRAQSFMALGSVYEAILADPTGDEVLNAERELNRLEIQSRSLRSLIETVEAVQRIQSTANPTIKTDLNSNFH